MKGKGKAKEEDAFTARRDFGGAETGVGPSGELEPSDTVEDLALVAQWEAASNVLGIPPGYAVGMLNGEPLRLLVVS